ncbi:unnamed protein product [Paramecium primaurelia]|uniref:Uncharacterized protein n=1 Tax=Paramecium primaurelia TaxID=5886 RepID=A0A8S1QQW9_PARPR|nr:unnamed protein product [Paramecium primaurelia]
MVCIKIGRKISKLTCQRDIKIEKQIESSDQNLSDINVKSLTLHQNNSFLDQVYSIVTILPISQYPTLQAKGAKIQNSEFIPHQGFDL